MTGDPLLLPDSLAAAGVARRYLTAALRGWPLDAQDTAVLLASELVSNALVHGAAPVTLTVVLSVQADHVRLRVEVHDANPRLPARPDQELSPTGERGRGLQIIDALAVAWGSRPAGGLPGKTSWFELDSA